MLNNYKGFTLLELMVVLAITGIVLAAAVPSFQGMISRNRIATDTNDMLLAINLARSEALRRGGTVSVQSQDASDNSNEFGNGYCVVPGNPGSCTGAIRKFDALKGDTTLDSVDGVSSIQFNSLGALDGGSELSFDVCNPSVTGRRIVITLIGRSKSYAPDADHPSLPQPGC